MRRKSLPFIFGTLLGIQILFGVCGDTVNAGQSGIYMRVNSYSNDVSEETSTSKKTVQSLTNKQHTMNI